MNKEKKFISHSPAETRTLGIEFAKDLQPGDIVGLSGDLGSGKTQFVKGICEYFGVKDTVSSPTFIIVNEYSGKNKSTGKLTGINHLDLYRLKNHAELKEIGIESYINEDSICLIEWPELAEEFLKGNIKKVLFEHGAKESERIIIL